MKNNKKVIIIVAILVLIIGILFILAFIKKQNRPEDVLQAYIDKINNQKYEEMYQVISKESKDTITQEDFIKRNKNIYEGIEVNNLKIQIEQVNKKEKNQVEIQNYHGNSRREYRVF